MFGDYNIHQPDVRAAVAAVVSNLRPADEVAANAHLVAAAPDLLAQLKFATKLLGAFPAVGSTAQVDAMRRAIASAEGRQA
nr:hypothetical protein [Sphingomonas laterariae]